MTGDQGQARRSRLGFNQFPPHLCIAPPVRPPDHGLAKRCTTTPKVRSSGNRTLKPVSLG